jgi:hypothetical protein
MKNSLSLYGILMLTIISCDIETMQITSQPNLDAYIITKSSNSDPYYVTLTDLNKYIGRGNNILDIQEYKDRQGITRIYAVNFKGGGFKLVSADKRANISLGDSDKGYMNFADLGSNTAFWMESCAQAIRDLSVCNTLTDEMQYNLDTWDFITGRNFAQTRAMKYVYLIDYIENLITKTVKGPYISTLWGQGDHFTNDHYWNKYCPWADSTMTGKRCPVGCVAVAGCQFAYHMKDDPDVNILIPTSAFCTGSADKFNYQQLFSSSLTELGDLPLTYYESDSTKIEEARIFLAYTGHLLKTTYSGKGSKARLDSLSNILKRWGINNSIANYSDSLVRHIIYQNEPIIASGAQEPNNDEKPKGHAWIIDGYKTCKVIRQNYYYISDTTLTEDVLRKIKKEHCNGYDEWQMPDIVQYHMNWGWNGFYDGWYNHDSWMPDIQLEYNWNQLLLYRIRP